MSQSKKMSLTEIATSTCIGLVVSLISNIIIFHGMHIPMSFGQNVEMTMLFTVISIVRGYFVRRLFNYLQDRQENRTDEHAEGHST